MGKELLLAGLVAYGGWWFLHGGRVMTEDSVSALYDREMAALAKLDSQFLCDQLHEDYRSRNLMFTLAGTKRVEQGKTETCGQLDEMLSNFKRLSALTGGRFGLSFDNRVIEVTLSDDRKTATVEAVGRISLGGRLLSKTHYVDTLVRRNGRIVHVESEGKSWLYVPDGN